MANPIQPQIPAAGAHWIKVLKREPIQLGGNRILNKPPATQATQILMKLCESDIFHLLFGLNLVFLCSIEAVNCALQIADLLSDRAERRKGPIFI